MELSLVKLRENWILLAFFTMLVLWYGNTNSRLNSVEAQQVTQETTEQKVDTLVIDVAVIKTQTKDANKKIDNLDSKVDYIISNMKK